IGALAPVADQRGVIAKALLNHAIGEFDAGIEIVRILKLAAVEQDIRPQLEGWQVSPGKIIDVTRWAKRWDNSTWHFRRLPVSGWLEIILYLKQFCASGLAAAFCG